MHTLTQISPPIDLRPRRTVASRVLRAMGVIGAMLVIAACAGSTDPNGTSDSSLPNPDGKWLVTADVGSCGSAKGSDTVIVSGGRFTNAKIFSYPVSGGTETVTITGTIAKGNLYLIVEGNEFLSGTSCNGGNGFYGFLQTSQTSGTVASAWGTLKFVKQ